MHVQIYVYADLRTFLFLDFLSNSRTFVYQEQWVYLTENKSKTFQNKYQINIIIININTGNSKRNITWKLDDNL